MNECWADEFNVLGWSIMTMEQLEAAKKKIDNIFKISGAPLEIFFGTNESLEFYSSDHVLNINKDALPITKEEHTVLNTLFGGDNWGTCNLHDVLQCIDCQIQDMEEDE